jgi:hypothetical protein
MNSVSNRIEYQEYFLGVKAVVPIVLKSGELNLLKPSGPAMGLLYLFTFNVKPGGSYIK